MAKWTRGSMRAALAGGLALLGLCGAMLHSGSSNAGSASFDRALGPLVQYALPEGRRVFFRGRVLESVAAGSYVYLLVERESGEQSWVVTLASARAGRTAPRVQVVALGFAKHFESKRLQREFPNLYFAVVRPS